MIDFLNTADGRRPAAGTGIGIKPISEANSKRLVASAITYRHRQRHPSVTLMHKGNIMKYTEGAFQHGAMRSPRSDSAIRTITEPSFTTNMTGEAPAGKVVIKDRIADMLFQQVLSAPGRIPGHCHSQS